MATMTATAKKDPIAMALDACSTPESERPAVKAAAERSEQSAADKEFRGRRLGRFRQVLNPHLRAVQFGPEHGFTEADVHEARAHIVQADIDYAEASIRAEDDLNTFERELAAERARRSELLIAATQIATARLYAALEQARAANDVVQQLDAARVELGIGSAAGVFGGGLSTRAAWPELFASTPLCESLIDLRRRVLVAEGLLDAK